MGDAPLPTHTFVNVSQLAWPGMTGESHMDFSAEE
jgi:hypothetical protein